MYLGKARATPSCFVSLWGGTSEGRLYIPKDNTALCLYKMKMKTRCPNLTQHSLFQCFTNDVEHYKAKIRAATLPRVEMTLDLGWDLMHTQENPKTIVATLKIKNLGAGKWLSGQEHALLQRT